MEHIHGTYDSSLVVFSYIIALAASYTALDLAGRVTSAKGRARRGWLLFGACIMGMGIWSMHFVGMLAFSLPVPAVYDVILVIVSLVAAVGASYVAMFAVGRDKLTGLQLLAGGALLAAGVSVMHYVGMAAMLIHITYDPVIFTLSIIIALGASIAALWLAVYFRKGVKRGELWQKLGSGAIMGAAIAGMHYTGMHAASFHNAFKEALFYGIVLNQSWLAYFIAGGTLFTLVLSIFGMYFAKRLAGKDSELEQSEKWYKSLYENNQDGIISVDLQCRIISCNPIALEITGCTKKQLYMQPIGMLSGLLVPEDRERAGEIFIKAFQGETLSHETAIVRHDGQKLELSVTNVPVTVDGQVAGSYIIFRNITEEKNAKQKINHLAFHDELTGLPNRRLFNQAIDVAIGESRDTGETFAVLVLDIDRFKVINDSLGHTYGDQFLKEVSARIQACTAGRDVMVARMGGDEFTLLCRGCGRESDVTELAGRIVSAIQVPYRLMENDFFVSASIGIAIFPEHGTDAVQLMKNADSAMYEVKKKGKNGFEYFSSKLDK
ncbi:sensor domain-containing diguanylate cyclase [Paenibacillus vietnamensis]|uniref:sensor domain-containing diguanylate cyclase n=1 Tax=Paenibacillus vietnamensis TaxID=2590547 RepID=UPI002964F41E|nr:diguanylate cyclase [Paenibacillus vietnamensis]